MQEMIVHKKLEKEPLIGPFSVRELLTLVVIEMALFLFTMLFKVSFFIQITTASALSLVATLSKLYLISVSVNPAAVFFFYLKPREIAGCCFEPKKN